MAIGSLNMLSSALNTGSTGGISNILGSAGSTGSTGATGAGSFDSILNSALSTLNESASGGDTDNIVNAASRSSNTNSLANNFWGMDRTSFEDIVSGAINNIKQTDLQTQIDAINVANGTQDDLHTVTMNLAKADLAVSQLVQVRNKALEAYNEIMRITL